MLYAKPRVSRHGLLRLCVGLAVVVGVLAGCGGASNLGTDNQAVAPAGVVPAAAHDPALVGTWMLVGGTSDGVVVAPKNITGFRPGVTRDVVVLAGNGTCTDTQYNAAGGIVHRGNGTWTGGGGTGTFLYTEDGGGTSPLTYTFQGANASTWAFTIAGRKVVSNWVRIVSLTGHDPALVKTWKATNVWVNGVAKPISYLTGSTAWPKFARRFAAAGTSQDYLLNAGMDMKVPRLAPKNWASGGGVLKLGTGPISEQIYVLASGQLATWQLDAAGNTLKILFKPYGAAGAHDARLLGTWHPVSVKVDGASVALKDFFSYYTGVNKNPWTFWADGTFEYYEWAGTILKYGSLDTWFTSAGTFRGVAPGMTPGTTVAMVAAYSFPTSSSLRWAWTAGGHTQVVVFAKDS